MKVKLLLLLAILFIAASPIFAQATGTAPAAANNWKLLRPPLAWLSHPASAAWPRERPLPARRSDGPEPRGNGGNPVCPDSRSGVHRIARAVHPGYHLHDLAARIRSWGGFPDRPGPLADACGSV